MAVLFSRKVLLAGVFIVLAVSVWMLTSKHVFTIGAPVSNSTTPLDSAQKHANQQAAFDKKTPVANINNQPANSVSVVLKYETLLGTPAEAAVVKNWFTERGYSSWSGNPNEYSSYNEETLKKLADGGDIRAMDALGKLYLDTAHAADYGLNAAIPLYTKAAIYGSTDALQSLGVSKEIRGYLRADTDEARKVEALEVLSIYNVSALRGDKFPNDTVAAAFISNNSIVLTEADQQKINERSLQIYNDLQQKRRDLGLGDFDNSVPPEVNKFFVQLEKH